MHNMKVAKIRMGYVEACKLKEQAKEEGISVDELKERLKLNAPATEKKPKKKLSAVAAAKRRFAKQQNVDVVIQVKGDDGQVVTYD